MSTEADLRKLIETITREPITDYHADPDDSNISRPVKLTPVTDEVMQAVNAYITATYEQVTQDAVLAGQISVLKGLDHDYRNHTIDLPTLILELIDDYTEQRRTLARLTGDTK